MSMITPPKQGLLTVAERRKQHTQSRKKGTNYNSWLAEYQEQAEQRQAEHKAERAHQQLENIRALVSSGKALAKQAELDSLYEWSKDASRALLKHPKRNVLVSITVETTIAPYPVILIKDCKGGFWTQVYICNGQAVTDFPHMQIVGHSVGAMSSIMAYTLYIHNALDTALYYRDEIALYQAVIEQVQRKMGA